MQSVQQHSRPHDSEISEEHDGEATSSSPQSSATPGMLSQDADRNEKNDDDLERTKSTASVAQSLSRLREALFIFIVCLAQLLTQAALGQVLSILRIIADSFGVTNEGTLAWSVNYILTRVLLLKLIGQAAVSLIGFRLIAGYSLTVGTFILMSGRLGDMYGYKLMMLIGFAWLATWQLVCGLAVYSNSVLFIFARVLSGIGPSLMLPNGLALLGAAYNPGKKKNLVFALFGGVAPGGSILGAAGAALFGQLPGAWWPWAFWTMSLVLFSVVLVGSFAIPPDVRPPRAKMSFKETVVALDLLGAAVGVTALILVNFSWNQAGVVGWSQPYVYVPLIVGLALVPLFFWIEARVAKSPLLPFDALNTDVAFVLGCIACGWGCFGIWVYYTWNFFEVLRMATPLQASAWFSPAAITGFAASLTTAWLLGRLRPPWVMTIALTAFISGTVIIATAPVEQTYWAQSFVMMLIIPFGMDMSFPAASLILSNAVPKHRQGVAMSLVNTTVNYSIALALGVAGTIEKHVTNGDGSRSATLRGYRASWYFAIGLAGLGLCLSIVFLIRSYVRSRA